jgi:hypothetical protein
MFYNNLEVVLVDLRRQSELNLKELRNYSYSANLGYFINS